MEVCRVGNGTTEHAEHAEGERGEGCIGFGWGGSVVAVIADLKVDSSTEWEWIC